MLKALFSQFMRQRAFGGRQRALAELRQLGTEGRYIEAACVAEARLSRFPHDPGILHFAGLAYHQLGRSSEAEDRLRRAVQVAPEDEILRSNFGEILRAAGKFKEAERELREAVRLNPSRADSHRNLVVLMAQVAGREAAVETARKAVALIPDDVRLRTALAMHLLSKSLAEEALPHLQRALDLDPGDFAARFHRERARRMLCDWTDWPQEGCRIVQQWISGPEDAEISGPQPFFAYEYPVSTEARLRAAQRCADRFLTAAGRDRITVRSSVRADRLRIGYLSADFHNHPTMHLAAGLFACHDRKRFEVWAYSMGPADGSLYREALQRDVEHFVDVQRLGFQDTLRRIRDDGIQILVDMKGFTYGAKPEVLARRAAPVQVQFLGYPGTMGQGLVDYLVADAVVAPPGSEGEFGEQLILMPNSYQINDSKQPIGPPVTRETCGLPVDGMVFCSFNAAYKLDPETFGVWMRILQRVPGSVLWLLEGENPATRENLRARASALGIDPLRLVFAAFASKAEHLARLANADLALDTRYINAHTGGSDVLWAGVPMVTLRGDSFPARVAASLLHAVGLPEFVASTPDEYEDLAVSFATDRAWRARTREHLRQARRSSRLFDTDRYVANLEKAYELMWRRHEDGLPAGSFSVLDR